jgi:hypothetical protein
MYCMHVILFWIAWEKKQRVYVWDQNRGHKKRTENQAWLLL